MHKNVFTLLKSLTGHYTKDEPNFTWRNNLTSLKLLWHEQVVNFKDFSRPFQVLFKTITKIQDLLKIYEPCNNNNYYNNNNNNNDKNNNNADKNDNDNDKKNIIIIIMMKIMIITLIISKLSMIVWVNVVLNRTAVVYE